jgi:uncharacterized protein YraI
MRALLLIVMIGLFASLALAQSGLLATVTQDLRLRVGPGTDWRIVATLPAGTDVALDGRSGGGQWVRGISSSGDSGWMASAFLTASAGEIDALPVLEREAPLTVGAPPQTSPITSAAPDQPAPAEEQAAAEVGTLASASASTTANVNLRSGPGTTYRRVGGAAAGTALNIDGRDPSLAWVRGVTPQGIVGWAAAAYIDLPFATLAALQIVSPDSAFTLPIPGAAASGGGAPAVDMRPVASTAPVSGFALGGHIDGFSTDASNWMHTAGMTWAKRQIRYTQGQDPGSVAGTIQDIHNRGFRVLLGVVGLPGQLNNGGYADDYAAFVAGLAALGADAIEVWNEPNIDREWPAGQIDPVAYTQLLARAYNAIKNANPNTMVISGAPAPTGFFGGCSGNGCDDAQYVAGMAAAGAANYMDCVGIHYNEGIVPPSQTSGDPRSEHYTRYFWGMVNAYTNAFGRALPLCFTELGYLSPEGFGPLSPGFAWAGNTTVAQQAAWLDQVVSLSRNSGRVRLLIIWNVDFTHYGDDPMAGYAIIRPGNHCPACLALAQ